MLQTQKNGLSGRFPVRPLLATPHRTRPGRNTILASVGAHAGAGTDACRDQPCDFLAVSTAAVNSTSVDEFSAVSVESCNTLSTKPTATTCIAT